MTYNPFDWRHYCLHCSTLFHNSCFFLGHWIPSLQKYEYFIPTLHYSFERWFLGHLLLRMEYSIWDFTYQHWMDLEQGNSSPSNLPFHVGRRWNNPISPTNIEFLDCMGHHHHSCFILDNYSTDQEQAKSGTTIWIQQHEAQPSYSQQSTNDVCDRHSTFGQLSRHFYQGCWPQCFCPEKHPCVHCSLFDYSFLFLCL